MKSPKNRASKQPHSRNRTSDRSSAKPGNRRPARPGGSRVRRDEDNRGLREDRRRDRPAGVERPTEGGVRIVKFLAACGVASRRKAADYIFDKRVAVNGKIITDVSFAVQPDFDRVTVDDRPLYASAPGLILFYKPQHIVSTLNDPHGRKNISTYLTSRYRTYVPVGRLDFESEGLMILTNDGDLCNVLLHPRYELDRVYEVHSPGYVSDGQLRRLEEGVELEDGFAKATVKMMHRTPERTVTLITIQEGRNRQVRRMFEAINSDVMQLKRTIHGPFSLGTMRPGEIKRLSEKEFARVREKVMRDGEKTVTKSVKKDARKPVKQTVRPQVRKTNR